jgi:hypothetical protein
MRIVLIGFSILLLFACNNESGKKEKSNVTDYKTERLVNKIESKTKALEQNKTAQIESVLTVILTTSPRYKQLTERLYKSIVNNGGTSFGVRLESCPNPSPNNDWSFSKTYDFVVFEEYPDRRLNTLRFTFNPSDRNLYEYDAMNDKLKSIEFNRNLLKMYDSISVKMP